jgi:WD40 repeat protein
MMAPGHGVRDDEVGNIRLYDFGSGKLVALLKGHTNSVLGLAFSPDGKRLISGDGDSSGIIWDVESRKLLHRLKGHTGEIFGVAFMPDGQRAVTGSYDTTLRLWRVSDGGLIAELKGHKDRVRSLTVRSSDGMIATGDEAGEVRLWDGKDAHFLRTLAKQGGEVWVIKFSPDGERLLSCDDAPQGGETLHVWEVATGRELVAYTGHDNTVVGAAISPDGRVAATSGGEHREIRVWELATGAPIEGPNHKPLVVRAPAQ